MIAEVHGRRGDRSDRPIPLEHRHGVVRESVVQLGVIMAKEGRDALRAAHQPHHWIDHVAAQLEHLAALVARQFLALRGRDRRIDETARLEDPTQPAGPRRFERKIHGRVVAPHITDLDQLLPGCREIQDVAKVRHIGGRRLVDVDMLAGPQRRFRGIGEIPNPTLDSDHGY